MRILIVPDKFKGTLSADQAASAIAAGWRQARPRDAVALLPMSDGGDGFGAVLARLLPAQPRPMQTVDAAHRPCDAAWWWDSERRLALVESAGVIGLALLPPRQFHPFDLDTYGLGAVLRAAANPEAARCLVGIGGSATNDGGFGLARSLGWTFLASDGAEILRWTQLRSLARIQPPARPPLSAEILVATDVQNPLLGPTGASRIYGPQKGLQTDDMPLAEECLGRLGEVVSDQLGLAAAPSCPGSGAAGGLGFGLHCFAGARLESGFGLFARYAGLEEHIRNADLVLTGEGQLDASTLMGKGVGEVATLAERLRVPCLGLAGTLGSGLTEAAPAPPFAGVNAMAPALTSPGEAMAEPAKWLAALAERVARKWTALP